MTRRIKPCPNLNRYLWDPEFRKAVQKEEARERRRIAHEHDLFLVSNFFGDDEPGWLSAARERVAEWEKGEKA